MSMSISTSTSNLPSLISSNSNLESALSHVEQASNLFNSPNSASRTQGENTFLELRASENALDLAAFFLQRSSDPFVLFQSLEVILHLLPTLPLQQPTPEIQSLSQLRDFILQIAILRGQNAVQLTRPSQSSSQHGPFPLYLRSRFYQVFSALEKRCLGLELSKMVGNQPDEIIKEYMKNQMEVLGGKSLGLIDQEGKDLNLVYESYLTGLSIVKAILDEFGLSINDGGAKLSEETKSKSEGKSKEVVKGSKVGLDFLQHRWCKTTCQTYLLPKIVSPSLTMLNEVLAKISDTQGQPNDFTIFDLLISTIERLLSWNFVLYISEAGLLSSATYGQDLDIFKLMEQDEETSEGSTSSGRIIPDTEIQYPLLSNDLKLLLFNSYRFSISSFNQNFQSSSVSNFNNSNVKQPSVSSITIHNLRQSLLMTATFKVDNFYYSEAGRLERENTQIVRNQIFLSMIKSLIEQECSQSSGGSVNKGNNFLFLIQLLQAFISINGFDAVLSSNSTPVPLAFNDPSQNDPTLLITEFFTSLSKFSVATFDFTSSKSMNSDEEDDLKTINEELVESLLAFWVSLIMSSKTCIEEQGDPSASSAERISTLNTFYQLSIPSVRQDVVFKYIDSRLIFIERDIGSNDSDDHSEQGSTILSDQEVYAEQLKNLSLLARISAGESLGHLIGRCGPVVEKLLGIAGGTWQPRNDITQEKELEIVWEQTHWLTMIVGHVLTDDFKGETVEIPREIEELRSLPENPAGILINQLGINLFHQLLNPQPNTPQTSPQLIQTILWFNSRWLPIYLFPSPSSNQPAQDNLEATFGSQISLGAGIRLLSFILQKISETLSAWLSDSDIVSGVSTLILSMTKSESIMKILLKRPEMESLLKNLVQNLDSLPTGTHGKMIESLVKCIFGSLRSSGEASTTQNQGPEHFFGLLTSAIEFRFNDIIHQYSSNFQKNPQRSDLIFNLQTSLEMLEGLSSSIEPHSSVQPIFDFVSKLFPTLVELVKVYSVRSELLISIVKVFQTLTRSLEIDFGCSESILTNLNHTCLSLLDTINTSGAGETLVGNKNDSALDDDVPFEGLGLIIELLNDLMKGNASNEFQEQDLRGWLNPTLDNRKTSDVCLFGFSVIVPMVLVSHPPSSGPLEIPSIKHLFGQLSSGLITTFPSRLIGLGLSGSSIQDGTTSGMRVFENSIKALTLILETDDSEVCLKALEAIQPFCQAALEVAEKVQSSPTSTDLLQHALDHLLVTLLRSTLLEPLDSSLLDSHLAAIRTLIHSRISQNLGGQASLIAMLKNFCSETSLISTRDAKTRRTSSKSIGIGAQSDFKLSPEIESSRRQILHQTIERLGENVFDSPLVKIPSPRLDRIGYAMASKEEYKVRYLFCSNSRAVVGKARGVLRVR